MPRKLKPLKVSMVLHKKSGIAVEIFLDRNYKDFFGEVAGETIRDQTERECCLKVFDACEAQIRFEWKKVIVVDTRSHAHEWKDTADAIKLKFRIHELAPRKDGAVFERFRGTCGGRRSIHPYKGKNESVPKEGLYVLPYSEDLATALEEIQRRIISMKAGLVTLLSGPAEKVIEATLSNALQLAAPAQKEAP